MAHHQGGWWGWGSDWGQRSWGEKGVRFYQHTALVTAAEELSIGVNQLPAGVPMCDGMCVLLGGGGGQI